MRSQHGFSRNASEFQMFYDFDHLYKRNGYFIQTPVSFPNANQLQFLQCNFFVLKSDKNKLRCTRVTWLPLMILKLGDCSFFFFPQKCIYYELRNCLGYIWKFSFLKINLPSQPLSLNIQVCYSVSSSQQGQVWNRDLIPM